MSLSESIRQVLRVEHKIQGGCDVLLDKEQLLITKGKTLKRIQHDPLSSHAKVFYNCIVATNRMINPCPRWHCCASLVPNQGTASCSQSTWLWRKEWRRKEKRDIDSLKMWACYLLQSVKSTSTLILTILVICPQLTTQLFLLFTNRFAFPWVQYRMRVWRSNW